MNRREFTTKALGAALAGIGAARMLRADDKAKAAPDTDTHICAGRTSGKGKGGGKSGDNGCAVPVRPAASAALSDAGGAAGRGGSSAPPGGPGGDG